MSDIAQTAINNGYQFECKKDGLRQNQDGTIKFTVNIHADDAPFELYKDTMGQRYMAVIVPIDDNEEPRQNEVTNSVIPKLPKSTPSRLSGGRDTDKQLTSNHAAILCKKPDFQEFIRREYSDLWLEKQTIDNTHEQLTKMLIVHLCGIQKSRSELDKNEEARKKFDDINTQYLMWLKHERDAA